MPAPIVAIALILWAWTAAAEQATPLDQPLPADQATLIAAPSDFGRQLGAGGAADGTLFHYRLYVPADYHDRPELRYPAMFVAAPGGDAEMGAMADRLKRDRWLVAMLVESRNGSLLWYPNFLAAYDDVVRRARVQPDMLFCTGFSGGARLCSVYPGLRPGFQGVILQGASFLRRPDYLLGSNAHVTVYGTFGKDDPNLREARRVRRGVPPDTRSLVEVWDGGHAWAPAPVFERALDWVLAKALHEPQYAPGKAEAYRWYLENALAAYQRAPSQAERVLRGQVVRTLGKRWQLALGTEADRELATLPEPPGALGTAATRELEAREAFWEVQQRDERERGGDPPELAELYGTLAARYSSTVYGELAAIRQRSVLWETGRR